MSERQFQAVLQEHLRRAFEAEAQRAQRDAQRARMYRPQEAYRSEDILRSCRELFAVTGKPDELVLECGVWRARKIRGGGQ